MAQTIQITAREGEAPYTERVAASNARTHVDAGDRLADEAQALLDFTAAEGVPETLPGGWRLSGYPAYAPEDTFTYRR